MTILFLTRLFYPHIGGVEKHVMEVSRQLVQRGHKVIVLTEQHQENLKGKEIINSVVIYRIPVGKSEWLKKFRIWRWLFIHQYLIVKADVVHYHDVFFWHLPFRFLFPKKPAYTTFHGYEAQFPPSKKAFLVRKLSEKLSKGNICVGDYIKKWYGTKPNYVTYGGIEIIQNSRQRRGSPKAAEFKIQKYNSKLKILFIGRLENDTGLLIYLEALKILRKKEVDFEFEVCGDGSLRKLAEGEGRVHGFVPNLKTYLMRSDLIFSSSYLSILQAMLFKRPVFAAYNNPLKEDYLKMAPFARWIVIENSAIRIARKIIYHKYNKDKYNVLVEEGYNWVKAQRWDNVVSLYLKLWKMN
ncbi:MAG: glycosyltransferase family 4 protein [Candidatus Levybacteria bacterium]|nr:glycosyltransferase family 4 protein [Candidatus Levybacteria bacterium]